MIMFEKFGQHQPLNRQAERYALRRRADQPVDHGRRGGIGLRGAGSAAAPGRSPCHGGRTPAWRRHDRAGAGQGQDRHGAMLGLCAGRPAVRRPDPPAAMFYYSRDRKGEHPQAHLAGYAGILQADAFDGYRQLYLPERSPGPIREAACWVHARRPFFAMADIEENARRKAAGKKEIALSPIAIEVVRRIDALFEIERSINGKSAEERQAVRQALSEPLVERSSGLYARAARQALARSRSGQGDRTTSSSVGRAFTLFLDDGRVCLSNNAAERALRGIALGQKVVAVLRLRPRRSACRGDVQPDRHGQNERRRSAGLAGRCPRPDRHPSGSSARRTAAVELDVQQHDLATRAA